MFTAIMTTVNFMILLAVCYFLLAENIRRQKQLAADRERFNCALATMSEKLASIPQNLRPTSVASEIPTAPKSAPGPRSQVQIALHKLNSGENPDDVARELGYSRSEMSILAASAKRGKRR